MNACSGEGDSVSAGVRDRGGLLIACASVSPGLWLLQPAARENVGVRRFLLESPIQSSAIPRHERNQRFKIDRLDEVMIEAGVE